MSDPGRKPPREVLRTLRQEVGFCCPVQDCGSPYLTWHHFGPPWRDEHHHRPEGMIALCREHADQADNGAFTDDQLRELKRIGKQRSLEVRGRFNWMRQDLLAVVGGNFFYEQLVIFEIGNEKCVWFSRDDQGYLQLNFKMPSITGQPRAQIEENFWMVSPAVDEVICPPSARRVEVFYHNGDKFKVEFFNIMSADALDAKYPQANTHGWSSDLKFPLTAVEVWETAAGTPIDFGPDFSRIGGTTLQGFFARGNKGAGIHLEVSREETALLFPKEDKTYVNSDIYLTELIERSGQASRIEGFNFINCRINGPIVVYPFGAPNSITADCCFQNPIETMLFEVPEESTRVGPVPLISCRFTDCEFDGVGIMGTPSQLTVFRGSPEADEADS